jgi:hypothetical protein
MKRLACLFALLLSVPHPSHAVAVSAGELYGLSKLLGSDNSWLVIIGVILVVAVIIYKANK